MARDLTRVMKGLEVYFDNVIVPKDDEHQSDPRRAQSQSESLFQTSDEMQ